jgi:hypothetical protein
MYYSILQHTTQYETNKTKQNKTPTKEQNTRISGFVFAIEALLRRLYSSTYRSRIRTRRSKIFSISFSITTWFSNSTFQQFTSSTFLAGVHHDYISSCSLLVSQGVVLDYISNCCPSWLSDQFSTAWLQTTSAITKTLSCNIAAAQPHLILHLFCLAQAACHFNYAFSQGVVLDVYFVQSSMTSHSVCPTPYFVDTSRPVACFASMFWDDTLVAVSFSFDSVLSTRSTPFTLVATVILVTSCLSVLFTCTTCTDLVQKHSLLYQALRLGETSCETPIVFSSSLLRFQCSQHSSCHSIKESLSQHLMYRNQVLYVTGTLHI